jgi:DNA-binding MarR family transcriptional regulator
MLLHEHQLALDDFIPYRLSYTSGLVSDCIAGGYQSEFGLTVAEWRVVAHIAANEGITQQSIVERTRMDKVTVSRTAIALRRRGLITRRSNPGDRRSQLLRLTRNGQTLYAAIAPKVVELERAVFGQFSAKELQVFVAMLRRIDSAALDFLSG